MCCTSSLSLPKQLPFGSYFSPSSTFRLSPSCPDFAWLSGWTPTFSRFSHMRAHPRVLWSRCNLSVLLMNSFLSPHFTPHSSGLSRLRPTAQASSHITSHHRLQTNLPVFLLRKLGTPDMILFKTLLLWLEPALLLLSFFLLLKRRYPVSFLPSDPPDSTPLGLYSIPSSFCFLQFPL